MAQNFNLNVNPYFEDFDSLDDYYQILFRPGRPIQARELNNLQATLQNQVGSLASSSYKEGEVVVPGATSYNQYYDCILLNNSYFGISIDTYINQLLNNEIVGTSSGVTAKVLFILSDKESIEGQTTLYIQYISASPSNFSQIKFVDGETIELTQNNVVYGTTTIPPLTPVASIIASNGVRTGSSYHVNDGVYFVKNYLVRCSSQTLILDQYDNTPSYRIGFFVQQKIVTPFEDESLVDNAQGFNNYAAPGADRLQINLILTKKAIDDFNDVDFIELGRVINGVLQRITVTSVAPWRAELARRTYDESGNYYVKPFVINSRESVNNLTGNNGIYLPGQQTPSGVTPSDDNFVYTVSPGKAYVQGFEVEIIETAYLDAPKPRTTNSLDEVTVPFQYKNSLLVNNISGTPPINDPNAYLQIYDKRDGSVGLTTVGLARVYDFNYTAGYQNDSSVGEIDFYDIQIFEFLNVSSFPQNLSFGAFITGANSGASGYFYSGNSSTNVLTLYETAGIFVVGEPILINGISNAAGGTTNNITVTAVNNFDTSRIKSLSFTSPTTGTFSADIVLNVPIVPLSIASQYTVTPTGGTTATITSASNDFVGKLFVGDIVSYSKEDATLPTYNRITSISPSGNSIEVESVPSVALVCDGSVPTSSIVVTNLIVLRTELNSNFPNLWANLPKQNVVSVATTSSVTYERIQLTGTVTNNSLTLTAPTGKSFQLFSPNDYSLTYPDGSVEILNDQKVEVSVSGANLYFTGLSVNNANNVLVTAVVLNVNVTAKNKTLNVSQQLIIDGTNSEDFESLGRGLTFKSAYGTRVQDNLISLNVCDVLRVKAVYQSFDANDPILPSIQIASINPSVSKIIVGEKFRGESSLTVATVVETDPINQLVYFVLENDNSFKVGENLIFYESAVTGIVNVNYDGSQNITDNYLLGNGQGKSFLDYGRLIKQNGAPTPTNKLLIIYDYYTVNENDTGSFVTQSSYSSYKYVTDIPYLSNGNISDIIDLRPRVLPYVYNVATPRSPFEFLSRQYSTGSNSASAVITPGETLVVGLSYYLPRIDQIFLDTFGNLQLRLGSPADNPQPPLNLNDAISLATVDVPAYLNNAKNANIVVAQYKRYQMKDISNLDQRIQNLEYYTNLSLLESTTLGVVSKDPLTGLDRFKSGFFVDNFKTHNSQDLLNPQFKASSDAINGYLRPSHYTTSIDLILGSYSTLGIGTISASQVDLSTNLTDLIGTNVRKTGDLITLEYTETTFASQQFATRIENVTPFLVVEYLGNVVLSPNSDTWIDTTSLQANDIELEGTYEALLAQFGANRNTGWAPIDWGAWETNWVGVNLNRTNRTVTQNTLQTRFQQPLTLNEIRAGTRDHWPIEVQDTTTTVVRSQLSASVDLGQTRTGTQTRVTPRIATADLGNRVVSRDLIPFMRSRNLQFVARNLKPSTQHYTFFDNVDMNGFIVPKLIEIEMAVNSPSFIPGETVQGIVPSSFAASSTSQEIPFIRFRLAASNHKFGDYLNPTEVYTINPYSPSVVSSPNIIPNNYSTSSTTLNVDTESLQNQSEGQFFGYVIPGMRLIGSSSQANAIVTSVRLISDTAGTLIGSLFFPRPNQIGTPTFLAGLRTFKLTSSSTNSLIPNDISSSGSASFYAQGQIDTTQETSLSIRFGDVSVTRGLQQSRTISGTSNTINIVQNVTQETYNSLVDPLAQTFYVNEPSAIFITSVTVYFKSKDSGNLPVILELRPVSNGYPTDIVLPFGSVVLNPDQVQISDDGSLGTTFTFPSPVVLNGNGTYYSIVIKSVSQSYTVYTARMGEVDITTLNLPDSEKVIVSNQPATGDLFKSGNGSTWIADGYEDLKFIIRKAVFNTNPGTINFYNPQLSPGNGQVANLKKNPFEMITKNSILSFAGNLPSLYGVKIYQDNSSTGNTISGYVSKQSGICSGLSIMDGGVGFSSGIYTGIGITAITGTGQGGSVNVQVSPEGVITDIIVNNGGSGYSVDDNFTLINNPSFAFGSGFVGIVTSLQAENTLSVDSATGTFNNIDPVYYFSSGSGIPVILGNPDSVVTGLSDGLHIKVTHGNHGMHDIRNYVTISDAQTNLQPATLTIGITTFTSTIVISDTSNFGAFEGIPVSGTNPGYATIDQEIISYTGITTNTLQGVITRGVDGTIPVPHTAGTKVYTYQLNNISLRRINTTFQLDDAVENGQFYPQLDYYYIKIDPSKNGTVRNDLFISSGGSCGGENVLATQNIQYETITPNVQVLTPAGTLTSTRIRTTSASSIGSILDNSQPSFIDQGYVNVTNQSSNDLSSPMLIASQINETYFLGSQLGNKSFNLEVGMLTDNENVSPCIDLTRVNCILTTNRLDNQIQNFSMDGRVNSLYDDPSSAIYISKPINLKQPATSLQVLLAANRASTADFRVLYRIFTNDSSSYYKNYQLFPGYNNLDNNGNVINPRNNDGLADSNVPSSTQGEFLDYQYSITNLPSFTGFVIKIILVGKDQANPPIIRDLRAIALV